MTTNSTMKLTQPEPAEVRSVHPQKFMLWLGIVSILMMFAGWTSGYLVRKAEGNWLEFEMPRIFWYSTGVLILSSISMHLSVRAAKKDNFGTLKTAISVTFALGMLFLAMQIKGFYELVEQNLYFVGNPSVSFFDVFIFIHGVHVISGIIVLCFAFVAAWRMNIHAKRLDQIEMSAIYWHFLDALWLYLFLFLLYNN
jgi:cytochrome c oxidase subunit III